MPPATASHIDPALLLKRWWIFDPVPDWIVDRLDRVQTARLGAVQLELTKSVLQAQIKAQTATLEILNAVK